MLFGDFLSGIEKLNALSGVVVKIISGEAALFILETVRVEAD